MRTYHDTLFGQLHYKRRCWQNTVLLPWQAQPATLRLEANEDDLAKLLPMAHANYNTVAARLRAIDAALQQKFLPLYNNTWRAAGEPVLDAASFSGLLYMTSLSFTLERRVFISHYYDAATLDLFAGHYLVVGLNGAGDIIFTDLMG